MQASRLHYENAQANKKMRPSSTTTLHFRNEILMINRRSLLLLVAMLLCDSFELHAAEPPTKRVLLIGQGPDGHPVTTHEYRAGTRLVAQLLSKQPQLQTIVVSADGEWADGPTLLDGADAVVLFVSQGAKWIQAEPRRLAAFQAMARRGGGFAVLHWGMGTKDAGDIPAFVDLFGGCHGGPDRRYKVLETRLEPSGSHPILNGVDPVLVHEEFYYQLKFPKSADKHTPLMKAEIGSESYPVAWCWERPAGGRSFGFSGLHFHANWKHESYRRLVAQAVLWTIDREIPVKGLDVTIDAKALELETK